MFLKSDSLHKHEKIREKTIKLREICCPRGSQFKDYGLLEHETVCFGTLCTAITKHLNIFRLKMMLYPLKKRL